MVCLQLLGLRLGFFLVVSLLCIEVSLGAVLRKSRRAQRDEEPINLLDVLACSGYSGVPSALSALVSVAGLNESCSRLNLPVWAGNNVDEPLLVNQLAKRAPSSTSRANLAPTPAPSGASSPITTVHITSEQDFALLLPSQQGGSKS